MHRPFCFARGCGFAALLFFVLSSLLTPRPASAEGLTLAVIPKGTTHEFWKSIHAGAAKAARELGIEIIWKGPQREDDRDLQIQVVEDFISRKVDGIVLAPLDDRALVRPVRDAQRAGIPTVVIDSGLQGNFHISFVATNNYKGGVLGARRLAEVLGGKGKIILLRYQEGSASTTNREKGFMETIKKEFPAIEILSDNQYAGATAELGYQRSENLLNRFPEIDGIFCPNESATFGMLRALIDSGRAGKIKFVGFDSNDRLLKAIEANQIHGLVVQNPFRMGELGVRTMVDHLRGKKIEAQVDTGVGVVTLENLHNDDIQTLLNPPLDRYLK